jgi:hypothetical protein
MTAGTGLASASGQGEQASASRQFQSQLYTFFQHTSYVIHCYLRHGEEYLIRLSRHQSDRPVIIISNRSEARY